MVIGCAIENDSLRAILESSARFAIRARTRETALTAISLDYLSGSMKRCRHSGLYHCGSSITVPASSDDPGGMVTRHLAARAQILNALAIGPKVPC